jgi:uncharacterized protein with FMN-binding domain
VKPAPALPQAGIFSSRVESGDVAAEVEVTVREGRIASFRLVSARNVDASVAENLFGRMTKNQTTVVDAVSGATASSAVVMKAASEALSGPPR